MKLLFVWPNKDSFGFKPLGLSLLAGIARDLNWDVKLFDTTKIDFGYIDNTESGEAAKIFKYVDLSQCGHQKKKIDLQSAFINVLKEFEPDCLALSVLNDEFIIASQISKIAKEFCPNLPVIWGGKYPTINPEKTLAKFCADYACVGEGLEAFGDFLKAFSTGGDLCNIPNIWAKKNGLIVENAIRPLKKDLDDLPYVNWEIFETPQFYKPFDGKLYVSGDHMLNWGCPYHCTYCINHFYHKMYDNKYFLRRYSIERIIDELKHLKTTYSLEFIKFHDEDFLMRPIDNFRELGEAYEREIGLPFVIETNPKSVTKEKVEILKRMNCVSASVAIETGDFRIRKNYLKRVDSEEDILKAFSLLNEAGIRTSAFNLMGIPFFSRETYDLTVEINRKANVQYPNVGFFFPFEGTELREVSIKEGFFNPEENEHSVYLHDRPALHFDNLSEEELIEMRNVFNLYIKLPQSYAVFIRRSEILNDKGLRLRKKLLEIYDKTVWANDGWYVDDGFENSYLSELNAIMNESSASGGLFAGT